MTVAVARDLRSLFGPTRHQGSRPTCLAFAASDAHAALRNPWAELSCEYLFYMAQKRAGRAPTGGTTLSSALESLQKDGQPVEVAWPYLAQLPTDLGVWQPPSAVGTLFTCTGSPQAAKLRDITAALDADRPTLVLMTLSKSFYRPTDGGVVDAGPEEPPDLARRHAVIAVGHGAVGASRVLLVRNSWGSAWADGGYGWLTERYLAPRIYNAAFLT